MALQTSAGWIALTRMVEWMSKPMQHAVLRVNTLRISPEEALEKHRHWLNREASLCGRPVPKAWIHPQFREAIVTSAWPNAKPLLEPYPDKADLPVVVVDAVTANAVLRGAPIFHGGILAISDNIAVGNTVRVDVFREGVRKWIGYGRIRWVPPDWEKVEKGHYDSVIEMTEGLSVLPPIARELVENGFAVSQSLPAIAASKTLDPQKGERILDYGCGTGFMSTHLAALTSNEAEVVAVDNSSQRLATLVQRCKLLGAKVTPVLADVKKFAATEKVEFDRILVHPDHSNIGVRPSVTELIHRGRGVNYKIREFVEPAVDLLKPGGRLVYCTGSALPIENDAVIRWLLDRRKDLILEPPVHRLAPVGVQSKLPTPSWMSLSPDDEKRVQRFGPGTFDIETDPVNADVPGFFIASLKKVL